MFYKQISISELIFPVLIVWLLSTYLTPWVGNMSFRVNYLSVLLFIKDKTIWLFVLCSFFNFIINVLIYMPVCHNALTWFKSGGVEQWVARLTRNVEFEGSSPIKATVVSLSKKFYHCCLLLVGSRNGFKRDITIELK